MAMTFEDIVNHRFCCPFDKQDGLCLSAVLYTLSDVRQSMACFVVSCSMMGISIFRSICRSQCGPWFKGNCEATSAVIRSSCCHVVVATGLMDSTCHMPLSVCSYCQIGTKAGNNVQ